MILRFSVTFFSTLKSFSQLGDSLHWTCYLSHNCQASYSYVINRRKNSCFSIIDHRCISISLQHLWHRISFQNFMSQLSRGSSHLSRNRDSAFLYSLCWTISFSILLDYCYHMFDSKSIWCLLMLPFKFLQGHFILESKENHSTFKTIQLRKDYFATHSDIINPTF